MQGLHVCGREGGRGGGWKRRGGREGGIRGAYLSTCSCSGEFCDSSWRRRQRRLARSSCCSWASWGASCLSHRHKHTCTKHHHCCPCASSEPPGQQRLYFWEGGKGGLLLPLRPIEQVRSPGPLGCWRKNQLFPVSLPVREAPLVQESTPPWREQASLGATSTRMPSSPSCSVSLHGVGKVPSPQFC